MFWSVVTVPVGPESAEARTVVKIGSKDECVTFYEDVRQGGHNIHGAIAVLDDRNEVIYACSE